MKKPITNVSASVRARLLNESKRRQADFQHVLQRYAAERFLYRLGASSYRDRFVLKGAMLFVLWDEEVYRPTRDVDLASFWSNDEVMLKDALKEIFAITCPEDGIGFAEETLTIEPIRDQTESKGFRLRLNARLEAAVLKFQVDVGFGDAIVPFPEDARYPVLLDAPAPWIRVYPREAVLAEKLHAMVTLGLANSRFKDFYDVHVLSERFAFAGESLSAAISATFRRRAMVPLLERPVALTPAFYQDEARALQWRRYLERGRFKDAPTDFAVVGESIQVFLGPPLRAVMESRVFVGVWPAGGPWQ